MKFHALFLAAALALSGLASNAQTPAPTASASPSASPSATATPEASPTPVPLADLTAQIVADEGERTKIEREFNDGKSTAATKSEITTQGTFIDAIQTESARLTSKDPSLDAIHDLERRCQNLADAQAETKRRLTDRIARLDQMVKDLKKMADAWNDRADQAAKAKAGGDASIPDALCKRMLDLKKAALKTADTVKKRHDELVLLLPATDEQKQQIKDTRDLINQALTQAMGRLFYSESPAIWSETISFSAARNLPSESAIVLAKQAAALSSYVQAQAPRFFAHAFLFVTLLGGMYWTRRRIRAWADDDPSLQRAGLVFEDPVSMAIAFSLLFTGWIYPEPPHLLRAIIGAAALIPAILILRRLVDSHFFPILNALVAFYAVDQIRMVAAPLPFLVRWLFAAELAAGILFLAWLLRTSRLETMRKEDERLAKVTFIAARLMLGVFAAALLANVIGCVTLGNLLGHAALRSTYLAVILYASTRVIDGLIVAALSSDWLAGLRMVRRYRKLLWERAHHVFQVLTLFVWASATLEMLSLRQPTARQIKEIFYISPGDSDDFTLVGQFLAFGLVVWAAFLLSRFIRFVLEEDFYPRMQLERGLSYSVSTMFHYGVLLIAFYVGADAVGISMTKFTILIGAFGVGMGLGLQNVINNFVSGVILLFERPIKVGDVVQMDAASGTVDRIGIRASVIRTGNGSEIIVPNGKFISDQVVNWTLSNRQRSITIPVGVAYGAKPTQVIELLKSIAAAHPLVCERPAPSAQMTGFGADALQFEINAWTDCLEQAGQIRSDLAVTILDEFNKAGISMPYTQRDLHLRSLPPELLQACQEAVSRKA